MSIRLKAFMPTFSANLSPNYLPYRKFYFLDFHFDGENPVTIENWREK